jgi:hypothetical protein
MQFTNYAIEKFISGKVTGVSECNATDIAAEFPGAKNWIGQFGLVAIFHSHLSEEARPFVLQFLRRVEAALMEYSTGREELLNLVSDNPGRWSPYFRALYRFESAIAQLYQAAIYCHKSIGVTLFKKNDKSVFDRLNKFYNSSKHQIATDDQPVWIENDGLATTDAKIAFLEIEDELRGFAKIVEKILRGPTSTDRNNA